MKPLYLASMMWCEREEPIIVGHNKKKLIKEALRLLHKENGHGLADRGQAMTSARITAKDIEITTIPYLP